MYAIFNEWNDILIFFNIYLKNWTIKIKYAHPKYNEYNTIAFSVEPQPIKNNNIKEKKTHNRQTWEFFCLGETQNPNNEITNIIIPTIVNKCEFDICQDTWLIIEKSILAGGAKKQLPTNEKNWNNLSRIEILTFVYDENRSTFCIKVWNIVWFPKIIIQDSPNKNVEINFFKFSFLNNGLLKERKNKNPLVSNVPLDAIKNNSLLLLLLIEI